MNILSIEPTPSPNTMKLNMDQSVPEGTRMTYTLGNTGQIPVYIQKLLAIPDVKSVFHTADFIAIERKSKGNWQSILALAREAFDADADTGPKPPKSPGEENAAHAVHLPSPSYAQPDPEETFGQAHVFVQKFKEIPLQVRVRSGLEEARLAMPERFIAAAMRAQGSSPNLIMERILEDIGVRYGDLKEIAERVIEELDAAYNQDRLDHLISDAYSGDSEEPQTAAAKLPLSEQLEILSDPDWKVRYALLDKLKPTLHELPLLIKALEDANSSIRRLATVYLGDLKQPEALPYLFQALTDKSVSVRRTAGDCLSDIGGTQAIKPMIQALKDPNKLVRWRAARFLYEAGDETAVEALHEAENDPEFEVSLQVKIALERIEGGAAAEGSVWQQMTKLNH